MSDEHNTKTIPVGTLYLTGESVEDGEVDLDKTIDYLKGIKDTLKFYVEKQNKTLAGKDYSIEVRIRPGSLITDVIGLTIAGGIVLYGKTALTEIAKNDTKDKTSADVARSAVSTLKVVVRIAKHFHTMMVKRNFRHDEARIIDNNRVELTNHNGERIVVSTEELEAYRTTPPTKLRQLVAMVDRGAALYIDDKPIDEDSIVAKTAEKVQFKDKKIFDNRDIEQNDRVAFPELTQDMHVTLDGELTRGNARTDTLGFAYDGRVLKAIPPEGGVKSVRDSLFGPVRIEAYVDRRSTAKGSKVVLKKPILRIVSIESIENDDGLQQPLL